MDNNRVMPSTSDVSPVFATRFEEMSIIIGVMLGNSEDLQVYIKNCLGYADENIDISLNNVENEQAERLAQEIKNLIQLYMKLVINVKELQCSWSDAQEELQNTLFSLLGNDINIDFFICVFADLLNVANIFQTNNREEICQFMAKYDNKVHILTKYMYLSEKIVHIPGDTDRPAFINSSVDKLPSVQTAIPDVILEFPERANVSSEELSSRLESQATGVGASLLKPCTHVSDLDLDNYNCGTVPDILGLPEERTLEMREPSTGKSHFRRKRKEHMSKDICLSDVSHGLEGPRQKKKKSCYQ